MDSKRLRPVCQGISYSRAVCEVREVPVPATLGRSRRSLSLCSKVATEAISLDATNVSSSISSSPSTRAPSDGEVCQSQSDSFKSSKSQKGADRSPSVRRPSVSRRRSSAALGRIPVSQLTRQLSFTSHSLDDLATAICEEHPDLDWLEDFWHRVLVSSTPPEGEILSEITLPEWVDVYNKWQALGGWRPAQAPTVMDANRVQSIFSAWSARSLDWVWLFDPTAHTRQEQTRFDLHYSKMKVAVPSFLVAMLVLSRRIPKEQKVTCLVDLFDEYDVQAFEEQDFTMMLSSLVQGVACSAGFMEFPSLIPKSAQKRILGKRCFKQVIEGAANRMSFWDAQVLLASGEASSRMVADWLLGHTGDPLAAPFALLLERVAARALPGEASNDEVKGLVRLSHTEIVVLEEDKVPLRLDRAAPGIHEVHGAQGCVEQLQCELSRSRLMLQTFENYASLPLLPQRLRQDLLRDFEELRQKGQGGDAKQEQGCGRQKQFFARVGELDHDVFLVATCPTEFRPKADKLVDKILGELLKLKVKSDVQALQAVNSPASNQPKFVKHPVPESTWREWDKAFNTIDISRAGFVTNADLRTTGLICPDICDFLCCAVGAASGGEAMRFTKPDFLFKLADLSGCRPMMPWA